jgi:hypothetical protein
LRACARTATLAAMPLRHRWQDELGDILDKALRNAG